MWPHPNLCLLREASPGCTHHRDRPLLTKSQRLLAAALILLFITSALFYSVFHQLHIEDANFVAGPQGADNTHALNLR